jgi:hypothetical protein
MVELYLDQLHDLLVPPSVKGKKLELREEPQSGIINILNVTTHKIELLEQANEIYRYGIS